MVFASKIFLIRPSRFGFNPQTSESNAFQKPPEVPAEAVSRLAVEEFDRAAEGLASLGIEVIVARDPVEPFTPDAVFPNNWFSTHPDRTLVLYPMEAEARRLERDPVHIELIKRESGIERTVDLTGYEKQGKFLEGTGSLVIDEESKRAYACLSSRTHRDLVEVWARETGYRPVIFRAFGAEGHPVYHTNVLMCVGNGFAVLCSESITNRYEREEVVSSLKAGGKEVIEISLGQMENFAGNMIQLEDRTGSEVLIMSDRARAALSGQQLEEIGKHTRTASFAIPLIERCGGGSIRCMIAELF